MPPDYPVEYWANVQADIERADEQRENYYDRIGE